MESDEISLCTFTISPNLFSFAAHPAEVNSVVLYKSLVHFPLVYSGSIAQMWVKTTV